MSEADLIKVRLEKLKRLKAKGINPYPSSTKRTCSIKEAILDFSKLSKKKKKIYLVGRIMAERGHGKASFYDLRDGSETIQLYIKENKVGKESYKDLHLLDIGDFLEVSGILFITHKGEKTLQVSSYKILAKSLRPLPEKWHGLKDKELKYRKRYLDFLTNDKVRKTIKLRSKIISLFREYLEKEGFLEIQYPVLESVASVVAAKPFLTRYNAYNTNVYLRIAIELGQKMIMVGGFEKVFEIGKVFRNEGVDRDHNPEFLICEFYWAYADYNDQMKLTEKLISTIAKKIKGSYEIKYQDKKINFKPPYPKVTFRDAVKKYGKLDIDKFPTRDLLVKELKKRNHSFDKKAGRGKLMDDFYKDTTRRKLTGPIFLTDHPVDISPLAKKSANGDTVERFQLVVNGTEVCNAYSELNDPIDQKERFQEQAKLLRQGDEEAQRIDKNFIEAMEYGMPPISGNGIGLERLIMFLTDSATVREAIPFPFIKSKK